jgi:hypothetical protein
MSLLRHGNFNQQDRITNFDPYSIVYDILYQTKIDLDYHVANSILNTYAEVYLLEAKEDGALHVAVNITEITLKEKHHIEELLIDLDPYNNTCYYMFGFDNLDEKAQLFHPQYKNIKETLVDIKQLPFLLEREKIEASLSHPIHIEQIKSLTNETVKESFKETFLLDNINELNKENNESSSGKSGRIKI